MKILCVGNSFSQDAARYVWNITRAAGIDVKIVNVYIGGCSLEKHYRNMLSEKPAYEFEINGMVHSRIYVSLKDALLSDTWDVITLQQQSLAGADADSFEPYARELMAYFKKYAPKARIFMNSTWGYKPGSERLLKTGFESHAAMQKAIEGVYEQYAEQLHADGIIPSGRAILLANERKAPKIYRDEYHMSYGFGRYLLGLVFAAKLCAVDPTENTFCDFDEPLSEEEILLAKAIAAEVCATEKN